MPKEKQTNALTDLFGSFGMKLIWGMSGIIGTLLFFAYMDIKSDIGAVKQADAEHHKEVITQIKAVDDKVNRGALIDGGTLKDIEHLQADLTEHKREGHRP